MIKKPNNKLIVVCGPTASGKTALGIQIAKKWNLEIISSDSRQFYAQMKIGTARPDHKELDNIVHHLLGSQDINQPISAAEFENLGLEILEKIYQKQHAALLVGGSGLYIKALCEGLDSGLPAPNQALRADLETILTNSGIETLQAKLQKLDPEYAASVDLQNPRRLVRALEVCITTGLTYSSLRKAKPKNRNFEVLYLGIDLPRQQLYERINLRVSMMLAQGLMQEATGLICFRHLSSMQTVGYREVFEYLDGLINYKQMEEKIAQNTRRYAKRQLTWLAAQPNIHWHKIHDNQDLELVYQKIEAFLKN